MFPVVFSKLPRTKLLRIISLLALASVLQACSAVKTAYSQAPTLAYFYLNGYVDFNDAQAAQVKAELGKFQAWHRQTQLPVYVELLQKVQQKMPQDLTASQACEVFADVRQKVLTMTTHAEPAIAGVAATLMSPQLDAMQRKFAKGNITWREDYLNGTTKYMREKREKSAVKRADMLYGSVNDRQRDLIAQQVEKSRFNALRSYTERQRRQKDVLQTLAKVASTSTSTSNASATATASGTPSSPDTAALQTEMRNLLSRSVASPDSAYRSYLEVVTQDGCANFAELHNTTTPEQRKKAVQVLAGYEQDFRLLMNQR